MSLSHLGFFGIARLVLLILGAYTLIEVLLPTVLAGAAGAT